MVKKIQEKLKNIQLIVLDVDGVLTDGAIAYSGDAPETKSFHVHDGFGITMARHAGLKFAIITGRVSESVARRAKELNFDYYESGQFYKRDALEKMIRDAALESQQVLYMGDDILDLVCKPLVGFFVAPNNALPRVKNEADWVTEKCGGAGAVREMVDAVLEAKGILKKSEDFFIAAKLR